MRKLYKVFCFTLMLSALLLSGCAGDNTDNAAENNPRTETGGKTSSDNKDSAALTDFEGTDMEGNTVSSAIFSQSKLTMINVWATYCNPCLSEMPELGELAEEYDTEELQIIGIISDVPEGEDQEFAESLIEQTGAAYPHLLLNESIYYALLADVTAVPTTFFINENGEILDTVVGAMKKSAWEEKINAFLAEQ